MTDTLNELNNFLLEQKNNKEEEKEINALTEIRDMLMKNSKLAFLVNGFIKARPPKLELSDEQAHYACWSLLAFLQSIGVIDLIVTDDNGIDTANK